MPEASASACASACALSPISRRAVSWCGWLAPSALSHARPLLETARPVGGGCEGQAGGGRGGGVCLCLQPHDHAACLRTYYDIVIQ